MKTNEVNQMFETLIDDIVKQFPTARCELNRFPSGAFMLDVFFAAELFVLECGPEYVEFGVSKVTDENSFTGADFVLKNFDEAGQCLKKLLRLDQPVR